MYEKLLDFASASAIVRKVLDKWFPAARSLTTSLDIASSDAA
jgi:hypothetical protein